MPPAGQSSKKQQASASKSRQLTLTVVPRRPFSALQPAPEASSGSAENRMQTSVGTTDDVAPDAVQLPLLTTGPLPPPEKQHETAAAQRLTSQPPNELCDTKVTELSQPLSEKKHNEFKQPAGDYEYNDTLSRRFIIDDECVIRLTQYHHLYIRRLEQLSPRLLIRIREVDALGKVGSVEDLTISAGGFAFHQKDGKGQTHATNEKAAKKRRNNPEARSEEFWVSGNLFKVMPNRPSILRDLQTATNIILQPVQQRYLAVEDQLWLEDSTKKVQLADIDTDRYMCGQTVAVRGSLDGRGFLHVSRVLEPGTPLADHVQSDSTNSDYQLDSNDAYVIFICGFGLCGTTARFALKDELQSDNDQKFQKRVAALTTFFDAVNGVHPDAEVQNIFSKSHAVIVAGNLTCYPHANYRNELHRMPRYLMQKMELGSVKGIGVADQLLSTMSNRIPFVIMPGPEDLTFHLFPQQPLSYALVGRKCAKNKMTNLRLRTNPYEFRCLGRHFLGTSGQNVTDAIKNCVGYDDPVEMLQYMLKCGHMAPTAPNTLAIYTDPSNDKSDPFVLDCVPDVFFAGNQPKFGSKLIDFDGAGATGVEGTESVVGKRTQKCLLLSLPAFADSEGCVVAVNAKNLSVKQLFFSGKTGAHDVDNDAEVRMEQ